MKIISLEIMLSDEDIIRFFSRHGLKCTEKTLPVVERSMFGRVTNRIEKVLMVEEPHSNTLINAKDAVLQLIKRRTVQLLLDDAEKAEVYILLREMGRDAEKKFLGI
jgi:hypothetical protein